MTDGRRRGRSLAALAGTLGLLLGSQAAAAQDLVGSRSLAMGGTLRAAPSADAAVLLNPAGMSLGKSYHVNGLYEYRASDAASLAHVSVVDSFTARVAAGLFYSFAHATPTVSLPVCGGQVFSLAETFNTHEAGLALAYPLAQMFHIGLTGKYVYQSVEQPEGTPEAAKREGISGFTMDVGGIFRPMPALHLAVTGQNLVGLSSVFYPRLLGLGVSYALGTRLLAEFDSVLNFSTDEKVKASYHVGGELFLAGAYALRAGYMYDSLRVANYVSGGLGLVSKKIALDFGLRQMVSGGAETTVAFSLRLFLN
jgi:hypothetical protein